MGVVYLARDPRLLRRVAIKVLPEGVARDPEWSARFQREAQLLASLDHPNIAVVYSLERSGDETLYLVMEFIEGESLADRIARGPLPVSEALRIGRRTARALEAAHRRGVVHRDLKPANVMVGPEGQVKVLDFGLAVRLNLPPGQEGAVEEGSFGPAAETVRLGPEDLPVGAAHTVPGTIVGTPGYLSPEQARSEAVDPRTDLFAFGCLLYECLTGTRAFRGRTLHSALASALRDEPDWDLLPRETSDSVRTVLRRCLAKDPEERPAHAGEISRALEETEGAPDSARSARRHNLPRDLSSFVGRKEEIARVLAGLRSSSLLTLTGAGGSGKTRLALKAALEALPDHADGVWMAEIASVKDERLVGAAIAAALGIRAPATQPVLQTLEEKIGDKEILLLLDNCEHVVSACAESARVLLEACPGLKILATSREALGLPGEAVLRVPSMSLPPEGQPVGPADLEQWEACRLFGERARAAASDFSVTEASAPVLIRICRRLDGIPLAIELAAVRVRVLSLEQIEERLQDRFRLLTGGSRTALERHQTLRATLDWSYGLLAESEQQWLRKLAVFSGGWDLKAAVAVGGTGEDEIEVLDVLTRLVDKSLISADASFQETRYRMLEMVRQYAREAWDQPDESRVLRGRHLEYFVGLALEARPHFAGGPEQAVWLDRLEADHENCQAALQWSEATDEAAVSGLKLAALLAQFWYIRGHGLLARSALQHALARDAAVVSELHGEPGSEQDRDYWRSAALNAAAHFLTEEGLFEEARPMVEEAVAIRRRLGSPPDLARGLLTLGSHLYQTGHLSGARAAQEEALEIARSIGHTDLVAFSLNSLAAVLHSLGNVEECRRHLEESLALRREQGSPADLALVLGNLGGILAQCGDLAGAGRHLEEALRIQREIRNPPGMVPVLENLGGIALENGEAEEARQQYGEALEITRRLGLRPKSAQLYARLGMLETRLGRLEIAMEILRESLRMQRALSVSRELGETLTAAACLAARRGRREPATRLLGAAEAASGEVAAFRLKGELAFVSSCRTALQEDLGEEGYASALESGRTLSLAEAMDEALELLRS